MSESPSTEATVPKPGRRSLFGAVGLLFAFLGLAFAVLPPFADQMMQPPPKPLKQEIAEVGAELIKKLKEDVKPALQQPPPAKQLSWPVVFLVVATAGGLVGIVLGVISWIRREDHRISGTAVAVGVGAITWAYLLVGAAILLGLLLLFAILHGAGNII
jgi:hypothetical protein